MPNSVPRVALTMSALVAVFVMAGVCAGVASADPEETGGGETSDSAANSEAPPVSEPQPTASTPPIVFDVPQAIPQTIPQTVPEMVPGAIPVIVAGRLRDARGRPLSIFGNGRIPGTHTTPGGTTLARQERPTPAVEPARTKRRPPPVQREAPVRKSASVIDVTLPFAGPFSIPVPDLPVPGYEIMRWTLDLTNPSTTYASLRATAATVNSLLVDALALHDPCKPPPGPQPAFRTLEEEPVDAGGTSSTAVISDGSPPLPITQLPLLVPTMRVAPSAPVVGVTPAGAPPPAVTGAGARVVDEPRGAVARIAATVDMPPPATGSTPNGPVPTRSGTSGSALRESASRYGEVARLNRVAMIAFPGLAGLVFITASGGVIGYRQANSGRYLRSEAMRFLA